MVNLMIFQFNILTFTGLRSSFYVSLKVVI